MSKVLLVIGSVREGRTADKVAIQAEAALRAWELDVDVADLKDVVLPFYNEPVPPIYAKGDYKNAEGKAWAKRVKAADAVVLLSPEYNYGTSAVLKNAIDWAYEWTDKPTVLVTYGVDGGSHVVEQLKTTMGVLGAKLLPTAQLSLDFLKNDAAVLELLKVTFKNLTEE